MIGHKPSIRARRERLPEVAEGTLRPLGVQQVRRGLHERAEGVPEGTVYRLTWSTNGTGPIRSLARLFRGTRLTELSTASARYIRVDPRRIHLPPQAMEHYLRAKQGNLVEEVAAFLDTRLADHSINTVLAARIQGRWWELYRWDASWTQLGLSRLDVCDV